MLARLTFLAVEWLDYPRLQLFIRGPRRIRQRALHIRQALLSHRARVLHRPLLPHPLLACAQAREAGLMDCAGGRVRQHAYHLALHRVPPVLGQRPVVVVRRDRVPVAVVGAHSPPEVVQEVQLPDLGRARWREPDHPVHPELRGIRCERECC